MKKADFILIACVVVVAGVLLFFLYGVNSNSGEYVQIEVDTEVYQTVRLDEDKTIEIPSDNGGTNTLVIENGYAKMVEANCPDGICKRHKKIKKSGESIICLPHKVVVSVVNDNNNAEIDAVA